MFEDQNNDEDAFDKSLIEFEEILFHHHAEMKHFTHPMWNLSSDERFHVMMNKIENCISEQLNQTTDESIKAPSFRYPNLSNWSNVKYDKVYGLVPVEDCDLILTKTTSSSRKYSSILLLLYKIWNLWKSDQFSTLRNIYYENVNDFINQCEVDHVAFTISAMLQVPRFDLRLVATSKGLVAGSICIVGQNGVTIEVSKLSEGIIIPQDIDSIQIYSNAKFILVVEKDATFQKLLDEKFPQRFYPCIVITAKGLPDFNTRKFLYKLWMELGRPIFALVDSDPYGIEIMCSYRFGSLKSALCCERTSIPAIRWLGVHPMDYVTVEDKSQLIPLSPRDHNKIKSLLKRPYIIDCVELREQIEIMKVLNMKVEIQFYNSPSSFVQRKIIDQAWL